MSMGYWIVMFIFIALALIIFSWSSPKPKKDFWESYEYDSVPTAEEYLRVLDASPLGTTPKGNGWWNKAAWEKKTPPVVLAWMVDQIIERHRIEVSDFRNRPISCNPQVFFCSYDLACTISCNPNLPIDSLMRLVEVFWYDQIFRKLLLKNPRATTEMLLKVSGSQAMRGLAASRRGRS